MEAKAKVTITFCVHNSIEIGERKEESMNVKWIEFSTPKRLESKVTLNIIA